MLAIAERMPETSESIPLIGELDFNFNAGVWYKSQQVCELGTSCAVDAQNLALAPFSWFTVRELQYMAKYFSD